MARTVSAERALALSVADFGSLERSLTQADDRGDVCELGVADALGDGEAGDRDASEEVVLEQLQAVLRKPVKYRDEVLERLPEGPLAVPESPEGVVGEQGFLGVRPEGGGEASRVREIHHPVERFSRGHGGEWWCVRERGDRARIQIVGCRGRRVAVAPFYKNGGPSVWQI